MYQIDDKWQIDSTKQVRLVCDTQYDDIAEDWLFILTPNRFIIFNILNEQQTDKNELHSITDSTLYGFYYRVSDTFWRKIESKVFFHRKQVADGIQYEFFYYDGFTLDDGTPNLDAFDGYKLVAFADSNEKLTDLKGKEWHFMDNAGNLQSEIVSVDITMAENSDDDIYKAYRRKWKAMKLKSFQDVTSSELQKDKLIKDTNNGLPFMMMGLGTGGLNEYAAQRSMHWALNDIGYRSIDGAQAYENEVPLGNILQQQNTERDDIFITSKVWPTNLGFVQTYEAILDSMNKVKTNYFDLYMIHWNRCDPNISWMHCEEVQF